MFDSPPPPPGATAPQFRLDPWSSDYGSAVSLDEDEEPEADAPPVDIAVETGDWTNGIKPVSEARPEQIIFVDGTQRIELWGRLDDGERSVDAALASIAVGAAITTSGGAAILSDDPYRVIAISSGLSAESLTLRAGRQDLKFMPAYSPEKGSRGVSLAIAVKRREIEQVWGERMTREYPDALVVLDGRLVFAPPGADSVIGLAKTLHRRYLPDPQWRLVAQLSAGERTPIFRIDYSSGSRYSWYLRLPHTRPIHHSLAGVVRLEAPVLDRTVAISLANLASVQIPRFASRPEHDPRAPQNLLPVGALEKRLHHEMGDAVFLRRCIEDHLFRAAAA
jgi:hypothetical protein